MGLSLVQSRALLGLEAASVTVEVHLANGLPSFTLVGLVETEVKEARERVRSALQNAGLEFPNNKRITVNLAPADLPKDSGRFDLPIALGILAASGQIDNARLAGHEFAGELSLSGELRPVRGALAMALALHTRGVATRLVLPLESAQEAALVPGGEVYGAKHLLDVVRQFVAGDDAVSQLPDTPDDGWARIQASPDASPPQYADLSEVKGHSGVKRVLEIAAAGGHSLLMVGEPGSGKSMLAQRFAGLLPAMHIDEALESAAVASLGGRFATERWQVRPTCAPHHTASAVALVGGGSPPRPGEISRAHHGVLFLDEFPEFARSALEALREPLETGTITIARAARRAEFPARFQLVAAMNPCPCGYLGSSARPCRCTPDQVSRYQGKLSGPLLDRIDLHIEVPPVSAQLLLEAPAGESTDSIRNRVVAARERAMRRQGHANQSLQASAIDLHAALDDAARKFMFNAAAKLGWSARSTHRALKVARTIADLASSEAVQVEHLAEAVQYRRALRGAA
ncbi:MULTISPECIES: YifB family Mg chelatase-like AAA ATPase [unclassified Variovorax]|jgi:magnesium chelatase family protein|uniref:YifB family Mg chelatase-like AAA ATPase n=1 Tax=unclassified Variovorax TaxID=663243 RepID=UPI000F7ECF33|nr:MULTISPECIES: YifB family Mg chelatase-like AAA ATPase [unclassified Variovorax]RSZ42277.1 ATP-binding protein [Variovorax sp. 553]RSZ43252.1 ATP-binding protein [Variovorax sp. 679]